jgi:hypothetical protein
MTTLPHCMAIYLAQHMCRASAILLPRHAAPVELGPLQGHTRCCIDRLAREDRALHLGYRKIPVGRVFLEEWLVT